MLPELILHEGREKSLLRHHPWVFSRAIASLPKSLPNGAVVRLISSCGDFLAYGHYSAHSQITVRALSFEENQLPDENWLFARLSEAFERRRALQRRGNEAVRVVDAEADLLPGLTLDRYGDFLVMAISSYGMDLWRQLIVSVLRRLCPEVSIYERSDLKARHKEGLEERCGVLWGQEPPDCLYLKEENAILLPCNLKTGHKTGAYLDQRDNRRFAADFAAQARVLNCFSYTGGFGLWCLKGGALSLTNVDLSRAALEQAKSAVLENHLDPGRCQFIKADVFDFLRQEQQKGSRYDLIILDPPKFADGAAHLKRACRGYQDINRLGFELLAEGGMLLTFSCSGALERALFQKIVADAAVDAGVCAQITAHLSQAGDHPVALSCPESLYLKGLAVRHCGRFKAKTDRPLAAQ